MSNIHEFTTIPSGINTTYVVKYVKGKPYLIWQKREGSRVINISIGNVDKIVEAYLKLHPEKLVKLRKSGRSLAWSRTSAFHAEDPGSNPGGRTTIILMSFSAISDEFLLSNKRAMNLVL